MVPHQVLAATLILLQPGRTDYAHHILLVLAATLILLQPGGTDYAQHILMSPPSFDSHRRT